MAAAGQRRSRTSPTRDGETRAQDRPLQPPAEGRRQLPAAPRVLNRFAVRCLLRDLDPAFHLTDDGVERVLMEVDTYIATVVAEAQFREAERQGMSPDDPAVLRLKVPSEALLGIAAEWADTGTS